jgi:adenine deaminase
VKSFGAEAFRLRSHNEVQPVIGIVPGQIVTRKRTLKVKLGGDEVLAAIPSDVLKLAVVERHEATGNVGVALVKGFGLQRGALASSFAHDSHNVVVVGTSDADMHAAVREVERMQGGLTAVEDGRPLASLSPEPLKTVAAQLQAVDEAAASLGATVPAPFAVLSFLALPVIPELKLTDRGLVDVERGAFVELAGVR